MSKVTIVLTDTDANGLLIDCDWDEKDQDSTAIKVASKLLAILPLQTAIVNKPNQQEKLQ